MSTADVSHRIITTLRHELVEAKKAAEYWEVVATTDDLTGLHNRRMLNEVSSRINERRNPAYSGEVTLLFIDLDDFGKLNKRYGDDVGDDALRLLGTTIRKNIRTEDIAIRKGGDEFVIILIGATPDTANDTVVQRLSLMLDGGLEIDAHGQMVPIRGSIGVFAYDLNISPLDNLRAADEKMRMQKQARKQALSADSKPATLIADGFSAETHAV